MHLIKKDIIKIKKIMNYFIKNLTYKIKINNYITNQKIILLNKLNRNINNKINIINTLIKISINTLNKILVNEIKTKENL